MTNFKRVILTCLIIILIILSISVCSYATQSAIVIKEDIRLRKSAEEEATILELIPKEEEIEIVQKQGDWYEVRYLKIRGYVRSDEIQLKDTNTNTTKENTVTPQNPTTNTTLANGNIAFIKEESNLQIRPLINSMTINTVKLDTQIVIIQIVNDWVYISSDTGSGWIRQEKLTAKKQETLQPKQEEKKPEAQEQEVTKTGYISSDDVNLRKEANTDAKVLKVFTKNTKVTIVEEQEEWIKIQCEDKTGYVSKQFISSTKVETTSRSAKSRQETSEQEKTTANTTKEQEIINYAKQFLGSRYVYGGETPTNGFDCSGFTRYVFKHLGINLTHSATAQSKVGTKVEKANLQPGDLVFFSDYKTYQGIGHCGIYIGDNMFIHASTEKTGVITSSLLKGSYVKRYVTATRVI